MFIKTVLEVLSLKPKPTGIIDLLVGSCFTTARAVKRGGKLTLRDIWTNCGLCVKRAGENPLYPLRISEKPRHYGRDLLLHLPAGMSEFDFYRRYDKLSWAWNAELEFEKVNGKLLIRIMDQSIANVIPFELVSVPDKLALPIPIGYSRAGMEWLDLAAAPHLLVAGTPGSGKSNFLHCLCASLIARAQVYIIDLKRLEFAYLRGHAEIATSEKEAASLLAALNREMNRRLLLLEQAGVVKIQDYSGDMPFVVCVIDELAELQDDVAQGLLNRLLRLSRACGISIVAATQRPSTNVISGDSRANFAAKLAYRVADELNSRMVLGETCNRAAYLPTMPGRAIFRWDKTREVQTMFLPVEEAKQRLQQQQPLQVVGTTA